MPRFFVTHSSDLNLFMLACEESIVIAELQLFFPDR